MLGFAKYAFNKSHATAYGIISYRTAYLKAHYPAEYFAALLTSVLDNTQKLKEYIADAQKHGVKVLPPDINASCEDFTVVGSDIRYGLLAIKNVGRQFASAVVSGRNSSAYKSFDEFVRRLSGADINKRTLESLIKCGVFDSLGVTRSALISCYENIVESEHEKNRNNVSGQMDMFSLVSETATSTGYNYPDIPEYSLKELLLLEKESSGTYFSGHMIDNYSKHAESLTVDRISDIITDTDEENTNPNPKYRDKQTVTVAGIITAKRTKTVKSGDVMAFIKLEDRFGEIEVIIFARQYAKISSEIFNENAVSITGTISVEEGEGAKILLSSLEPLKSNSEFSQKEGKNPRIFIKVPSITDNVINKITRISLLNPGKTEVVVFDASSKKYSALKGVGISHSEAVIDRLSSAFGEENVVVK
jgi:DNA polymerase-3 subunit alpha